MSIEKYHVVIGAAVVIVSSLFTLFVATSDPWRYADAVEAKRAGRFTEALSIVAELSPEYQARSTATYLKSDCHLQLAQREAASGNHLSALEYLKRIPQTFQKYGDVVNLLEASTKEVERLVAEKAQGALAEISKNPTAGAPEYPSRLRTYGGAIPYDRKKYYSKEYYDMVDEIEGRSSEASEVRLKDVMSESELDAYSLKQAADLLKHHTIEELNRMSDREVMELMIKNHHRYQGQ